MLEILAKAEKELPSLLADESMWQSLYVDYHAPFVERLWCEWSEYRLYLHRIHPCSSEEALFHPHPWPSAMRVLSGTYEMALGYGASNKEPPVAARLLLGPGSVYEMTDPDAWHYVRPIGEPTMSLMITGKPWSRTPPKATKKLTHLTSERTNDIIHFFRSMYC